MRRRRGTTQCRARVRQPLHVSRPRSCSPTSSCWSRNDGACSRLARLTSSYAAKTRCASISAVQLLATEFLVKPQWRQIVLLLALCRGAAPQRVAAPASVPVACAHAADLHVVRLLPITWYLGSARGRLLAQHSQPALPSAFGCGRDPPLPLLVRPHPTDRGD